MQQVAVVFWYGLPGSHPADPPARSEVTGPAERRDELVEAQRKYWDLLKSLGYDMRSARP